MIPTSSLGLLSFITYHAVRTVYRFPSLPTITPEPGLPAPRSLTVNAEVIFASFEKLFVFFSAASNEPELENDFKELNKVGSLIDIRASAAVIAVMQRDFKRYLY